MKMIGLVVCALICVNAVAYGAEKLLLTPEPERITDEAIAADIGLIDGLQGRLAKLNSRGTPIASYHFAKAQAWLDFARDEYTINDRSRVVEEALHQALSLIEQLEEGKKDISMATPIIPTSSMVRPDLWEKAKALKKRVSSGCAGDKVAQLEVQLVWAGHENGELGWRHSKPYLQAAERLAREAEAQMEMCPSEPSDEAARNEPATLQPEPASAKVAVRATNGDLWRVGFDPVSVTVEPAGASHEQAAVERGQSATAGQVTALTAAAGTGVGPGGTSEPAAATAPVLPSESQCIQVKCPDDTSRVLKLLEPLPDSIHFALDRAEVSPASARVLDRLVAVLNDHPAVQILLQGYADERGDFSYNLDLSLRRAKNTRAYLMAAGLPADRVSITALGKAGQLVRERTIEGYALNRRVEFVFTTGEVPRLVPQLEDLQPEKTK